MGLVGELYMDVPNRMALTKRSPVDDGEGTVVSVVVDSTWECWKPLVVVLVVMVGREAGAGQL